MPSPPASLPGVRSATPSASGSSSSAPRGSRPSENAAGVLRGHSKETWGAALCVLPQVWREEGLGRWKDKTQVRLFREAINCWRSGCFCEASPLGPDSSVSLTLGIGKGSSKYLDNPKPRGWMWISDS